MKGKIYYLATCSTCAGIMKQLPMEMLEKQDIKTEKITPEQLLEMRNLAGSYEALFSRNALKYRSMNLKEKSLSEDDYRELILDEYTFLRRPVVVTTDKIFIGNAKSVTQATIAYLEKL